MATHNFAFSGRSQFAPESREPAPRVICIHSSTASGAQWGALRAVLEPDFEVHTPDLYGYGDGPAWPGQRPLQLADEVERLRRLIVSSPNGVHLVGHSYGGAVAAKAALTFPGAVHSLTVYEPVLFGLLRQCVPGGEAAAEIQRVASRLSQHLGCGEAAAAAQGFIDYWNGRGSWNGMPQWQQAAVSRRVEKTEHDFCACTTETLSLSDLKGLPIPKMCLHGGRTTLASRTVSRLLIDEADFEGASLTEAGHLGPLTHAHAVNARILAFIGARPDLLPGRHSGRRPGSVDLR